MDPKGGNRRPAIATTPRPSAPSFPHAITATPRPLRTVIPHAIAATPRALRTVIPAEAGIQASLPVLAPCTLPGGEGLLNGGGSAKPQGKGTLPSGKGNREQESDICWIPAFAGMTVAGCVALRRNASAPFAPSFPHAITATPRAPSHRHSRGGGNPGVFAGSCSLYPPRRGGALEWRRFGKGLRQRHPFPPGRETGNRNQTYAGFPPSRE